MVRFKGFAALVLGTAFALTACGDGLTEDGEQALEACQIEVRDHLDDAGAKDIAFGESQVDDEEEGNWVVSGPVEAGEESGNYECRVVESELDKERNKRIADVRIAPHLLRE